ncbi:hypothetical protein ACLOJK_018385 [Asimina triloba]
MGMGASLPSCKGAARPPSSLQTLLSRVGAACPPSSLHRRLLISVRSVRPSAPVHPTATGSGHGGADLLVAPPSPFGSGVDHRRWVAACCCVHAVEDGFFLDANRRRWISPRRCRSVVAAMDRRPCAVRRLCPPSLGMKISSAAMVAGLGKKMVEHRSRCSDGAQGTMYLQTEFL